MSAVGTKRTFQRWSPMSAFGGKADIAIALRNVCYVSNLYRRGCQIGSGLTNTGCLTYPREPQDPGRPPLVGVSKLV